MNGQSRETVIYGGAFNPPTRAHQAILQGCIDYAEPRNADIWLLPSAGRRDKAIDEPRELRLELCRALVRDVLCRTVEVAINTTELDRERSTETYETVRELNDLFPERQFIWVFGADSVMTMADWNYGGWLLDTLDMLVVERPGYATGELGPRATRLMVDTGDISSTELRGRLRLGVGYDDLVSPSVGVLLSQ